MSGMSAEEPSIEIPLAAPPISDELAPGAQRALERAEVRVGTVESPVLALVREWLSPMAVVASLGICLLSFHQPLSPQYIALGLIGFLLAQQALRPWDLRPLRDNVRPLRSRPLQLLLGWLGVLGLLTLLSLLLNITTLYARPVVLWWYALTPLLLLLANHFAERYTEQDRVKTRRHVIVGGDDLGVELARRIRLSASHGTFMGFFDFRRPERLHDAGRKQFAGHCQSLAAFVREHTIDTIYIALPISNAPRIESLLRGLRDTTASIYFVPNVFQFDLIQARCVEINGMALISICDTPFHGMNAVRKRVMDLVLASFVLLLTWPLMLLITITIWLSFSGPILFKQRRYGLHGEEIVIYKFRTMTVCEDADTIAQAVREDRRITPIGRFLRRSSLDELPQVVNVLQGRMSFVGPRPHAVAHNEQYRRLICGYMIRHKIRPGITGWAQVNGYRGETETIEKMRRRVACDIEYLKNWSLWLDLKIVARTAFMVFDDRNAY